MSVIVHFFKNLFSRCASASGLSRLKFFFSKEKKSKTGEVFKIAFGLEIERSNQKIPNDPHNPASGDSNQ